MAGYNINVDVGGTFTDGFFVYNGETQKAKVETTPHDQTVSFIACLGEGARKFGVDIREMMSQADVVRYSTTAATNTIIQRNGSKIGLMVTKGFERSLYDSKNKGKLYTFVSPEMVVGIDEETNALGTVVKDVNADEVIAAAEYLLDNGAKVVVVSFQNSEFNNSNERKARSIMYDEYPRYYLGGVNVLLASDITTRMGAFERTNTAVINSYLHADLVRYLYKGDEELTKRGFVTPMSVVHNTGGMATVAKTIALNTYDSGPTGGVVCASHLARLYGIKHLLGVDIGGTSTDISLISNGAYRYSKTTEIEGCPIHLHKVDVHGLGAGGGSIARVVDGQVQVGPASAGALPGPACFDLGGEEPTTCDAVLVLGYVSADGFEGGRRKLVKANSVKAIKEKVADPLKISVDEAASKIYEVLCDNVVRRAKEELEMEGVSPSECVLLAFGGQGPVHCCEVAAKLGISKVLVPKDSDVLSALGCSLMDTTYITECLARLVLQDRAGNLLSDYRAFNALVSQLQQKASSNMAAMGVKSQDIKYMLELDIEDSEHGVHTVVSPVLNIRSEKDVNVICAAYRKSKSGGAKPGAFEVVIMRLNASTPMPHYRWPALKPEGKSPEKALKGKRDVVWQKRPVQTNVYRLEHLQCGNVVEGPAIIDAEYTTVVLPTGWKYTVDAHLNGVIEKV
jgi:N-methylhydantoinase A/acetophenone carboxylase